MTNASPIYSHDRRRSLSRLAGNSGWNLFAFLIGILANLVMLPFVIRHLGMFQFGICGLLLALATPLSLVGTTLGQSTAQGIARYRSQDDPIAIGEFCATMITVGSGGVVIAGIFLGLITPLITRLLYPKFEVAIPSIGLVALTLACGWAAQQFSLLMQGIHVACQAYRRIATVNALGAIGGPLLIFIIVRGRPDVQGYILALALGYGLTSGIWAVSIMSGFSWCLVRPRLHRKMIDSIVAFTSWQMLAQLIANVASQADRYLLGAWVSPSAVGFYNVSQRVEEVAYIGVMRAGDSLFPHFSMNASASAERQSEMFFRASWMLNLLAAIVLAPLLPWAPSLLLVWVGAQSSQFATPALQVLTIAGLLGCAGNVFSLYALGIAKTRYIALLSVTTALTSAVGSALLLRTFGFRAAGMGSVVGMLANLAVMISLTRRHFGGHARARHIIAAIVLPIAAALAVAGGLAIVGMPILNSWPKLLIGYAASVFVIMLCVVLLSTLTPEGRCSLLDLRRLARLPIVWLAGLAKPASPP